MSDNNIVTMEVVNTESMRLSGGIKMIEASSHRDIWGGWAIILLFFLGFGLFSFLVPLDSAVTAEGSVTVFGNRQAVQHRDGGVVSALYVHEGQYVTTGQILLELNGGEVAANERALASQVIGLQAEKARLQSELTGQRAVNEPVAFARLDPQDRKLADDAMRLQRAVLAAHYTAIGQQRRVLQKQAAQLQQKRGGLSEQIASGEKQATLFDDELSGVRALAEQGYASMNRVRELERARAQLSGQNAGLSADRASIGAQLGETQMRSMSLGTDNDRVAADELRKVDENLADILPKWNAARHLVEATKIRATASGSVVGLTVFTVGGVIGGGQKLMDIVPKEANLVVTARVNPNEANDLRVGDVAELRFPSLHERRLPMIEGKVTRVSADIITDEKTNTSYYTIEATVDPKDIEKINQLKGRTSALKPGLPVQVLVKAKKRTLIEYLMEPFRQALWRSGHEL